MTKNSIYYFLLALGLASCNPFTIATKWGEDGVAAFFLIGIIISILIIRYVFIFLKAIKLKTKKKEEKFETKPVILFSLLSIFLILNGIKSTEYMQKFNFCKGHVKDYVYKTEDELKSDSEYRKVEFLNLSNKKVIIVKTGHGKYGRIEAHLEKEEITMEDIIIKTAKSQEEAKKDAYQLSFEFDGDLYRKLPNEFQVSDEKDFKSVAIIIQKDYYGSVVGKYTNGSDAVQSTCRVLIYDIFEKLYVEEKYFVGTDPPKVIGPRSGSSESEIPKGDFLKYIINVIKKQ